MSDYVIGLLPAMIIGLVCGLFINPWWIGVICCVVLILAVEFRAFYFGERPWR